MKLAFVKLALLLAFAGMVLAQTGPVIPQPYNANFLGDVQITGPNGTSRVIPVVGSLPTGSCALPNQLVIFSTVIYMCSGGVWVPISGGGGGGVSLDSPAFTGNPTAPTQSLGDSSTKLATTAFVKGQGYISSLTATGDVTGTASGNSIALTLANSGATPGTYGNGSTVPIITVDAKGRITAVSTSGIAGGGALPDPGANGIIARTGAGTTSARTLTAASAKLVITNPTGAAGNPTFDVSEADLTLANLGGNLPVDRITGVAVTGGASLSSVGAIPFVSSPGVLGQNGTKLTWDNSTFQLGITGSLQVTGSVSIVGSTFSLGSLSADPAGVNGMMYYNTATSKVRCYQGATWVDCVGAIGPQGPPGADGGTGATGATGATGPAGRSFIVQIGAPTGGQGNSGDSALDSGTGLIWDKTTSWAQTQKLYAYGINSASGSPAIIMSEQAAPSFPHYDFNGTDTFPCVTTSGPFHQLYFNSTGGRLSSKNCNGDQSIYALTTDVSVAGFSATDKAGTGTKFVTTDALHTSGHCAEWTSAGLGEAANPCGTGGGGGTTGGGGGYSQSFTSQTSITVSHNLGTSNVVMACFDNTGKYVVPNSWTIGGSAPYDITVSFTNAQTGRCVVAGMGKYSATFTSQTSITVPASSHGFASCNLQVQIWDNSSPIKRINPNTISCDTSTLDVVITFTNSQSGRYVIM